MSHRHSEEIKNEPKQVISSSEELNPFLSKNDLTILTMAIPFLSANGQKLLSFFINFNQSPISTPDFSGILNLFNNNDNNNNVLRELLPALLGLAVNTEQGNFDPGILKSLIGMINTNHTSNSKEPAD